ncbi:MULTISPECIES: aldehyde dehydrogenase family protein [Pseudomonas]|jgi:aldehyde dehydrogenase (NAD+)|uniref:aldehyde dehydrogenase family protein n=1 Tax=Pseudomonas TaxID=286 RepID=UPI0009084206|nr:MULTISPECIES: aldehyde dehydrogenase family protein [Pseudomonas]APC21252.1 aldehyde dehydrogenase [Pseudomonas protegens]AQT09839.1 aldehyde dehydrogenase [Pseudomonas protegens]MBF0641435.1 aldehyde dehydrogenase [Pseudomonas protegens]MCS4259255.1 acyl-CoA reductase-like NAD-dependent aldehyde dehydrogenase [Pseudomonas sp. BIGb0176]MDK1394136.1 aldehyde dehydrogenase family protein [Pseudomonas protegens]
MNIQLDEVYGPLINGVFESRDKQPLPALDPATGKCLATIHYCDAQDVDRAVNAAQAAFAGWNALGQQERGRLLNALADAVEADSERLAWIDAHDVGRCISEVRKDYLTAVRHYRYFASVIMAHEDHGREIPGGYALGKREPLGVCGQIIPWNAPAIMASFKLAPALAAGNTVVLKPDENASLSTLELGKHITRIFPAGVVNIVTGLGEVVGAALSQHPKVRKLSFTGSTEVGRIVARVAADRLVPATLELGGKSANIVFPDIDDLDAVVDNATFAAIHNNGQSCLAGTRLFVHDAIFETFKQKLIESFQRVSVGSPLDENARVSCLVSARQGEKVLEYIALGVQEGAELLVGGARVEVPDCPAGYFIQPTVFEVRNDMRICREEIFGPVLSLIRWSDYEQMIAQANDSEYGLAAGIYTSNLKHAMDTANRLEAGSVWINRYSNISDGTAFGGYKNSGIGREFSRETLNAYTQIKTITVQAEVPAPWFAPR